MADRPALEKSMASDVFRACYYLKEELVRFCRENGWPTTGGKQELTDRIAHFLETGDVLPASKPKRREASPVPLDLEARIPPDFVCSEGHRAFFKQQIGPQFSFRVAFQIWLKENAGKTYREAVAAYRQLLEDQKKSPRTIDKQFEYNTYIRDFFADNPGGTLQDAIACWNQKKGQQGQHRYEPSDLAALGDKPSNQA